MFKWFRVFCYQGNHAFIIPASAILASLAAVCAALAWSSAILSFSSEIFSIQNSWVTFLELTSAPTMSMTAIQWLRYRKCTSYKLWMSLYQRHRERSWPTNGVLRRCRKWWACRQSWNSSRWCSRRQVDHTRHPCWSMHSLFGTVCIVNEKVFSLRL